VVLAQLFGTAPLPPLHQSTTAPSPGMSWSSKAFSRVCALSRWHSPGRSCPLWDAIRSPVASPLRLLRVCTARRSRTLMRAHGLCSSRPQTTVESGCVLAQCATLHCGARPRGSFGPWRGCKNINPFFFSEIHFKSDSNFQNS
jgi:hypothetical protein